MPADFRATGLDAGGVAPVAPVAPVGCVTFARLLLLLL
tara:strand:- start:282 stop:395 length:114 start_codon:yes stop_codon:yes gene_type:complete